MSSCRARALVGEIDQGWTIAKYLLGHERMGGGALGNQKNGLRSLKEIAADQELGRDGTFMRKIAEVEIELQTLEMQMLRMLAAVSADKEIGAEASMIKIRRTEIQQRLSELKMEAAAYDAAPYQIEAMEHGWNEEPVRAGLCERARRQIFQRPQAHDLLRLQRNPAQHHLQSGCWSFEPASRFVAPAPFSSCPDLFRASLSTAFAGRPHGCPEQVRA